MRNGALMIVKKLFVAGLLAVAISPALPSR